MLYNRIMQGFKGFMKGGFDPSMPGPPSQFSVKYGAEQFGDHALNVASPFLIGGGLAAAGLGAASLGLVSQSFMEDAGEYAAPAALAGIGAIALGALAFFGGRKFAPQAMKSMGNWGKKKATSMMDNALGFAAAVPGQVWGVAKVAERMIRPIMTGRGGAHSALDAWFPYARHVGISDPRKFGLNPTVARRAIGVGLPLMFVAGIHQGVMDVAGGNVAPPQVYVDGTQMRHVNDMGADANYGQRVLGRNSLLSEIGQSRMRMLSGGAL